MLVGAWGSWSQDAHRQSRERCTLPAFRSLWVPAPVSAAYLQAGGLPPQLNLSGTISTDTAKRRASSVRQCRLTPEVSRHGSRVLTSAPSYLAIYCPSEPSHTVLQAGPSHPYLSPSALLLLCLGRYPRLSRALSSTSF